MTKRTISILLCAMLLVCILPLSVFAVTTIDTVTITNIAAPVDGNGAVVSNIGAAAPEPEKTFSIGLMIALGAVFFAAAVTVTVIILKKKKQ